jgi:hypothetical protein
VTVEFVRQRFWVRTWEHLVGRTLSMLSQNQRFLFIYRAALGDLHGFGAPPLHPATGVCVLIEQ